MFSVAFLKVPATTKEKSKIPFTNHTVQICFNARATASETGVVVEVVFEDVSVVGNGVEVVAAVVVAEKVFISSIRVPESSTIGSYETACAGELSVVKGDGRNKTNIVIAIMTETNARRHVNAL